MTGEGQRGGVVLLHGHGRVGASLFRIDRVLQRSGYTTLRPTYRYRRSLLEIVDDLQPSITDFAARFARPVNFVTHSLGGLVARALMPRLSADSIARTVMLGPPNGGSEWADLLFKMRIARLLLGETGHYLRTERTSEDEARLHASAGQTGIIAGSRALDPVFPRLLLPGPNDGKVAVSATKLKGSIDHIVLPVSHTLMVYDQRVIRQVLAFLDCGRFIR